MSTNRTQKTVIHGYLSRRAFSLCKVDRTQSYDLQFLLGSLDAIDEIPAGSTLPAFAECDVAVSYIRRGFA